MTLDGTPLTPRRGRDFFRRVQMVFQDPYGSLHPRQTVDRALSEPLLVHGIPDRDRRIRRRPRRRRPPASHPLPLPPPAQRRPAPARRHRPRPDVRARDPAARRTHQRPRRLRPGRDPQPAQRPAAATQPHLPSWSATTSPSSPISAPTIAVMQSGRIVETAHRRRPPRRPHHPPPHHRTPPPQRRTRRSRPERLTSASTGC